MSLKKSILFIASGNAKTGLSPIIFNQGESLKKEGLEVEYYLLEGKGFKGYLNNISTLRKHLKKKPYTVVHAHYALIGIIAALAGAKPLVVSLMGSDVYEFRWLRLATRIFSQLFWTRTLVKSDGMKTFLGLKKAIVLPNGVDFGKFKPIPHSELTNKLPEYKHPLVIFIGNPSKREKNISLAYEVMSLVQQPRHEFVPLYGVANDQIPYYMNRASVLLLTSLWEGSPNVIKEAMACNLPIVSVDVGDVREIIGTTDGCFVSSHSSSELASKVRLALQYGKRTDGRSKIQHLSSELIAKTLHSLYNDFS